jgi:hypothetical protein
MSNIFEKIIDKHVVAFKESVTNDIRAFLSGEAVNAPKATAKTKTSTPKAPTAVKPGPKPRVDVTAHVADLLKVVAAHTDGIKGEDLRATLKLDKPVWLKTIKTAIKQKALTTKGQKRSMTYHLKASKAKKAAETEAIAAE